MKSVLIFLVVLAATSFGGPTRAEIILSVSDEASYGLQACLGDHCIGQTALPGEKIRFFNGGMDVSLSQDGAAMHLLLGLSDTSGIRQYATTAAGPPGEPVATSSPLKINIVGTSGEPVGTPVSLRLQSRFVALDDVNEFTQVLNGTNYDRITDTTLGGFKVGDSFTYWASIGTPDGANASFGSDLTVAGVGIPNVPEPGALALLTAAGLVGGTLSLWRRRTRFRKA